MAALPRMDQYFARLAETLRSAGLDCRYIMPSMQGDLLLSFHVRGKETRFLWRSDPMHLDESSAGVLMGRPFLCPAGFTVAERLSFMHEFALALSKAGQDAIQALDRRNRNTVNVPRCAEGVRQLAAQYLQIGRPFWGEYVLTEVEDSGEDNPLFIFRFASPQYKIVLAFIPDKHKLPGAETLADTPLGLLFILQDERPPEERGRLLQQPERGMAWLMAVSIHSEMRWTDPLPELDIEDKGDQPGPGQSMQEIEQLPQSFSEKLFQTWDLWAGRQDDFFANWGNDDLFYLSLLHSPGVAHIAHGGRECPAGTPQFFDPLEHRTPSPFRFSMYPGMIKDFSFSDVDDKSTIFGGEARLREILDQRSEKNDEMLLVTHHCEYLYTGDRARDICEKHPLACTGHIRYLLPPMPQFVRAARELNWWEGVVKSIPKNAEKHKRSVNLIGLAASGDPYGQELADMLNKVGITVNSLFYPTIETTKLKDFDAAELCVMRPWAPVRRVIGELLAAGGFSLVEIPAPYGIEGSVRWMTAIDAALQSGESSVEKLEEAVEETKLRMEKMCSEAAQYKAAFVMRGEFVKDLTRPEFFFGLDPLALLHEFGFETEIFSLGQTVGRTEINLPESAKITELEPETNIVEVLKSSDCNIVYSDHERNSLISQAGKTAFSIFDIRMGFKGAEETLRVLLSKARMKFYSRYGAYLGRSHG